MRQRRSGVLIHPDSGVIRAAGLDSTGHLRRGVGIDTHSAPIPGYAAHSLTFIFSVAENELITAVPAIHRRHSLQGKSPLSIEGEHRFRPRYLERITAKPI